jgi:hypothetical protein
MKKKTVVLVALCAALALSFTMMATACGEKAETPAEPPANTDTTDTPSETGGQPNPITEATPDQVKDKFSIEFQAPDEYSDGATYSFIGDTTAQMEYSMETGKGTVKVTYRVSRDVAGKELSGVNDEFSKTEEVKLEGGQTATVSTNDSTGPGVIFWTNESVASGSINASVLMDPIQQASELTDVANFFASQESKGF